MLSTRIREAGYEVSTATCIQEASAQLSSGGFDALVCDAILTDGTPEQIIESFRRQSDGPVVICSGYPQSDPILAELHPGDDAAFLQKPFSTKQLLQLLCKKQSAA